MKFNLVFLLPIILVLTLGGYFGFQAYQKNQENQMKIELETLKSIPETERCVISIRGQKYDVSLFRNNHPGGNIFKCGEDMTDAFNKQHGEKQLQQIQKYKIS